MADRMTGIRPRNLDPQFRGRGVGLQHHGRETRIEMIRAYRRFYQRMRDEAEYALSLTDDELIVETYLGPIAQNNRQEVTDADE